MIEIRLSRSWSVAESWLVVLVEIELVVTLTSDHSSLSQNARPFYWTPRNTAENRTFLFPIQLTHRIEGCWWSDDAIKNQLQSNLELRNVWWIHFANSLDWARCLYLPLFTLSWNKQRKKKSIVQQTIFAFSQMMEINSSNTSEVSHSLPMNQSNSSVISRNRHVCWRLPTKFEPSIESVENQFLQFLTIVRIPLFYLLVSHRTSPLVTRLHSNYFLCLHRRSRHRDQHRVVRFDLHRMLFLQSTLSLHRRSTTEREQVSTNSARSLSTTPTAQPSTGVGTSDIRTTKPKVNTDQWTIEESFGSRLSNEIDELKNTLVPNTGEDVFELREELMRFRTDLKLLAAERDALLQDLNQKQVLLRKHDFDLQRQVDIVTQLNDEVTKDLIDSLFSDGRYRSFDYKMNWRKNAPWPFVCSPMISPSNIGRNVDRWSTLSK